MINVFIGNAAISVFVVVIAFAFSVATLTPEFGLPDRKLAALLVALVCFFSLIALYAIWWGHP